MVDERTDKRQPSHSNCVSVHRTRTDVENVSCTTVNSLHTVDAMHKRRIQFNQACSCAQQRTTQLQFHSSMHIAHTIYTLHTHIRTSHTHGVCLSVYMIRILFITMLPHRTYEREKKYVQTQYKVYDCRKRSPFFIFFTLHGHILRNWHAYNAHDKANAQRRRKRKIGITTQREPKPKQRMHRYSIYLFPFCIW